MKHRLYPYLSVLVIPKTLNCGSDITFSFSLGTAGVGQTGVSLARFGLEDLPVAQVGQSGLVLLVIAPAHRVPGRLQAAAVE